MFDRDHPERMADEVFLGNFTPDQWEDVGWRTKRKGINSYTIGGSPFPFQERYGVFPGFVKRQELVANGVINPHCDVQDGELVE